MITVDNADNGFNVVYSSDGQTISCTVVGMTEEEIKDKKAEIASKHNLIERLDNS